MTAEWPGRCTCILGEQLESEFGVPLDLARTAPDFAYLYNESQRFCSNPRGYVDKVRAMAVRRLGHPRFVQALDDCLKDLCKQLSSNSHAPHLITEALQIAANDMPMIEEIQGYGAPDQVVSTLCERLTDAALFTAGRLVKNVVESLVARHTVSTSKIDENRVRVLSEIIENDSPEIIGPGVPDVKQPVLVVATAGRGTRLRTTIPKALVPLAGRPLLKPILDSASRMGIRQVIIVLKHGAALHPPVFGSDYTYVIQKDAYGTGHSFSSAFNLLKKHEAPCILSYSDNPFLNVDCFQKVYMPVVKHQASMSILTVSSIHMPEFGHLVESRGRVRAIHQPRFGQQRSGRADGGLYALWPFEAIPALLATQNCNYRYEYSFTDIVSELDRRDYSVKAVAVNDPREVLGINRPADLILARQWVHELRAALSFYSHYGGLDGEALSAADLLYVAYSAERVHRFRRKERSHSISMCAPIPEESAQSFVPAWDGLSR